MSSDGGPVVIRAEHLGKRYRIGARRRRHETARDAIAAGVSHLLGRLQGPRADDVETDLWALDDLTFDIHAGESVGIIGRNGAGKSTLFKVLSEITEPTTGFVEVTGRVGSLLEVGTGFHPDLTGRENTYMNGAILGMSRAEIERKFDEIVAFAEIDRFIDTPVKHYSSGMYMRLAFAVAAHLETEILLVDEVLAVGDAQFQKKCLGKMDDVARRGRTVLFISHSMEAIQRLCTKGLLLERGRLRCAGSIDTVVAAYRQADAQTALGQFSTSARHGTGWARVQSMVLTDGDGRPVSTVPADHDLHFALTLAVADERTADSVRGLVVQVIISNDHGDPLLTVMNVDDDGGVELPAARACRLSVRLPGPTFTPGRYRVRLFVGVPDFEHVDEIPDAFEFAVVPPERPWRPYELHPSHGPVCRHAEWACAPDIAEAS